jgi:hypothetical protein
MSTVQLTPFDLAVRSELTRAIAALGYAPSNEHLAERLNASVSRIETSLQDLHNAHALLLHPHRCAPWVVHPFALSPGSCWVQAGNRGWWANCLYCAMGIAAALNEDADIHTRIGGEREPLIVHVRGSEVQETGLLFHLSTPVRHWWDNVIHACATFQPFHSEADVEDWCERHRLPRGAIVPLPVMWRFASDWYGNYLDQPWRKRSLDEAKSLFEKHGFGGEFWRLD